MKKVISLLLALVLCLGLCACGQNGKYVGTYRNEAWEYTTREGLKVNVVSEMVLKSNGTGTGVVKSATSHTHFLYGKASIAEGDVLISSNLTWKVMDGYLVINATGMRYFTIDESIILPAISSLDSQGVSFTTSFTGELKGNVLEVINSTVPYYETGLGYSIKVE